jgi:hypothetical protein
MSEYRVSIYTHPIVYPSFDAPPPRRGLRRPPRAGRNQARTRSGWRSAPCSLSRAGTRPARGDTRRAECPSSVGERNVSEWVIRYFCGWVAVPRRLPARDGRLSAASPGIDPQRSEISSASSSYMCACGHIMWQWHGQGMRGGKERNGMAERVSTHANATRL